MKLAYALRTECQKEQQRQAVGRQHARKRVFLRAYKAKQGCIECGESNPIVLDLHHPDPNEKNPKLRNGGKAGSNFSNLGWDTLKKELLVCIVLCANCHRREEYKIRHGMALSEGDVDA